MKSAAAQEMANIIAIIEEPNVSSDFNHDDHSANFAVDQTRVVKGRLVRVMAWYDNEWGFSNRMLDTAVAMGKLL